MNSMKELTISKNDAGQRLDRFIGKAVPLLPESLLQKYIRLKRIKVNDKGAKRDYRLNLGDNIKLYINDEFFEKPREENSYLKVSTPRLTIISPECFATVPVRGIITRSLPIFKPTLIRRASGGPERRIPLLPRSVIA